MKQISVVVLLLLILSLSGCGEYDRVSAQFDRIDALCDINPEQAALALDSMDYGSLSERERHHYDLLSIKSKDKAYVRHTSDSLILDVLNYYSSHKDDRLYPEALYYGGRVYSDIGDLPTALEYFQKALDEIPDDRKNLRFRSIVLNQTGRLLHHLRLDSAAIDYLKRSLVMESSLENNDFGIAFTHKLLGNCYLSIGDIKSARSQMEDAVSLSSKLSDRDRYSIEVDYARLLTFEGKYDSALNVIRPLPSKVDDITLPSCIALASEIYGRVNIADTAYMYARQLTLRKEPGNKRTGYKVIFSDRLRDYVPKDTLLALIPEYKRTIESYLNTHEGESAIMQHTRYNYDVQVRERKKTEYTLHIVMTVAVAAVILSLALLSIVLYNKFRKSEKKARYMTAVNRLKDDTRTSKEDSADVTSVSDDTGKAEDLGEIKKRILSGICSSDEKDMRCLVNQKILGSSIYSDLSEKLKAENAITVSEEDKIWSATEELIETASPGFDYRLRIITEGTITSNERKLAMLIKCGFTPLQVSILLGRQKNTISTHRRNLAAKITGKKKADRNLDMLIVSL